MLESNGLDETRPDERRRMKGKLYILLVQCSRCCLEMIG